MPSLRSMMVREQIRLLKPLLSKMPISADRAFQDKIGDLGTRELSAKLETTQVPFEKFEAAMITPAGGAEKGIILYLHGGGYVAGSLRYAQGFGSVLAYETNRRVLCVGYRLAPENPYPAALEDAYEAYRYLLRMGVKAQEICLAGESAGGGLCFCLVHKLKAEQISLPSKIVAVSPWADLRLINESVEMNELTDPAMTKERLAYYAQAYAEGKLDNHFVSPICGSFLDFPPALVFVGGDEILLDDSIALQSKYNGVGGCCELVIEEGLWHVYVLYGIPEGKKALQKINDFLEVEKDGPICQTMDETG